MEIRVVTTDANAVVLVGGQRVAGPGMTTGTPTPEPAPAPAPAPAPSSVTTVAGLPLWSNMDPEYNGAHKGRYYDHGPAVAFNAAGQPVDAQGRAAGPKPKPAYESTEAEMFRLGLMHWPGDDNVYDAWGNLVSGNLPTFQPDPMYPSEDALFKAVIAADYNVAVVLTRRDGSQHSTPGFGPPDLYAEQPDGSVVRTN